MQIWVDADACPKVIKEILFRAAERASVTVILVANKPLRVPSSPYLKTVQVPAGFDVADKQIVLDLQAGDLVITADIPLAAEVIEKGGHITRTIFASAWRCVISSRNCAAAAWSAAVPPPSTTATAMPSPTNWTAF